MNKSLLLLCAFLFAVMSSAAVFADAQPIYKWTDAQGTVHYSDKPPKEAATDLQTMDLPAFPPQDPAKIAADQAALAANTAALIQQRQAEEALQQREQELALERAQLQASRAALQQSYAASAEPAPVYALYANSPSIPRSFRRNLYLPHRPEVHQPMSVDHPMLARPAAPVPKHP
ncbi:MAG TPA: DUF4124 domain-containing protein [Gammaproteobacteria bacterium]|jgi:opacity protein-like surface antigen|nr:DUF4124 domain-containing protein [Gammaproteobacteria bacterium]